MRFKKSLYSNSVKEIKRDKVQLFPSKIPSPNFMFLSLLDRYLTHFYYSSIKEFLYYLSSTIYTIIRRYFKFLQKLLVFALLGCVF